MFTQPAFIRKNTPEIQKKLEELGYKRNSSDYTLDCNNIFAYQYPVKGFHTPEYVVANSFDIPFDKDSCLYGKFIDCETNEDLFLAIAALKDDTDKNQWFVFTPVDCTIETHIREFFMCNKDKIEDIMFYYDIFLNCHKATVEELIEHFKTE